MEPNKPPSKAKQVPKAPRQRKSLPYSLTILLDPATPLLFGVSVDDYPAN